MRKRSYFPEKLRIRELCDPLAHTCRLGRNFDLGIRSPPHAQCIFFRSESRRECSDSQSIRRGNERPMRILKRAALGLLATAALATAAPAVASANDGPNLALGKFSRNLLGASAFAQSGTNIAVNGAYFFLRPNRSYFTVIYANGNCDPAQAFPVGPFTTDQWGRGVLSTSVTGAASLVAGTKSVSVRRGDDNTDIDKDGKTGPTDVVAVPGKPGIGLIECDGAPVVR